MSADESTHRSNDSRAGKTDQESPDGRSSDLVPRLR